ncbi:MAG: nucleotidyl transferase AbiEii/AbiGii toxin family protein [Bacteroidales bacterium]|nr:nucleotidyl transferase AbiEii/AbiGii toxin family protein [Bacteroidales bacterium]
MLYFNTVSISLKQVLIRLMNAEEFSDFRLVGGTALSLQLGHRISVDIDLFTDVDYGSIDFEKIEKYLKSSFSYVDFFSNSPAPLGTSYLIGKTKDNAIKLDVFYTDSFIHDIVHTNENIRLATIGEIIAMKIDVIQRGGRKKDFWDLHELIDKYNLKEMLSLHQQRYPYNHNEQLIIKNFLDFTIADADFNPNCLKGKYWEFIKEDIIDFINKYI